MRDSTGIGSVGFVLYDDDGKPCVAFGYLDEQAAQEAAMRVNAALTACKSVYAMGR